MTTNQNKLLDIAAFSPKSLVFPNSWIVHLPFDAWVIQEVSPKIFVELGTHSGNSYFSFCQSVADGGLSTKCYAVDTWQGDEHTGDYTDDIFNAVNAHNEEYYAGFSKLLRTTFDDAVFSFTDTNVRKRKFGVWELWGELQACYPNNLEVVHSNGFGVLQLNNAPDDKMLSWLKPSSPEKQQITNYFASLGTRQLERF